jgi:hypothetical protein
MASSKTTSASTAPSDHTAHDGQVVLLSNMRSILMNKISYKYYGYLNGKAQALTLDQEDLKKFLNQEIDKLLNDWVTRKGRKTEPEFTKMFATVLQILLAHMPPLKCNNEGTVSASGRVDVYIFERDDKSDTSRLVTLFEFGKTENENHGSKFAAKVAQGVRYLSDLASTNSSLSNQSAKSPKKDKVVFDEPVLLCVAVFNQEFTRLTIGVFCCEHRPSNKITHKFKVRLSLLYRKTELSRNSGSVKDIMADVLCHVNDFRNVRHDIRLETGEEAKWMYLGPNCALGTEDSQQEV